MPSELDTPFLDSVDLELSSSSGAECAEQPASQDFVEPAAVAEGTEPPAAQTFVEPAQIVSSEAKRFEVATPRPVATPLGPQWSPPLQRRFESAGKGLRAAFQGRRSRPRCTLHEMWPSMRPDSLDPERQVAQGSVKGKVRLRRLQCRECHVETPHVMASRRFFRVERREPARVLDELPGGSTPEGSDPTNFSPRLNLVGIDNLVRNSG